MLYGEQILSGSGNLQLPRDELKHAFVLLPLAEIAPDARVPGDGRSLRQLWQQHAEHAVRFAAVALDD